jgi:RimJ/RimL family protein N-acetyltransferase
VDIRVVSPFPSAAWPRVWAWIEDFRNRVADDFGPKTLQEFVAWQIARESIERTWAVYRDGELCGMASFVKGGPETGEAHALFRKDYWGRETTHTAMRMVYAEIFAAGIHKIVCLPFRDNNAMVALCKQLGFEREGTFREQTRRGGLLVDQAILGLTKGDFEKCLG